MRRVPLGELAELIDYGVTASADFQAVGPKFLRITDIQDGEVDWTNVPYCKAEQRKLTSSTLRAGDIVFARTGATTGKSFLITTCPQQAVFASYLIRVRPSTQVDPSFLAQFFQSADYWKQISSKAVGAAQPGVNASKLKELAIPLPLLSEQRRIAAILDQADALRAKRRAALAQLDEMSRAIFVEMVKAPGSSAWPTVAIGSLAKSMRTGPFGSQLLHSEFTDVGVAVLGIDNAVSNDFLWGERRYVSQEKYNELTRFRVFAGDVIVTIMGTCGRAAIVPNDIPLAITTKHLCSITLDTGRCIPEYLHACFLLHPDVQRQLGVSARGAVMPGLNMGLIRETMVPLPPPAVQYDFAKRLNATHAVRRTGLQSIEQLDLLFASLQHRAFAGEL